MSMSLWDPIQNKAMFQKVMYSTKIPQNSVMVVTMFTLVIHKEEEDSRVILELKLFLLPSPQCFGIL